MLGTVENLLLCHAITWTDMCHVWNVGKGGGHTASTSTLSTICASANLRGLSGKQNLNSNYRSGTN